MVPKRWMILVIALLALMFMILPAAHAACGDPPGISVNWQSCDKTGVDLTGIDMTDANLNMAILDNAILDGTNLTGANLNDASLVNANIDGANLTGANLNGADLTGAVGTPITTGANFNNVTCPDGSEAESTEPFCDWTPTAVTLTGMAAAAINNQWPWALAGLLLAGLVLLIVARRRGQTISA